MKVLISCLLMWAAALPVLGQGFRVDKQAATSQTNMPAGANTPVLAIPAAKILVCTTQDCTSLASIYQDEALTVPAPNPLTAGGATPANLSGQWGFWGSPGSTVWYKITTTQGIVYGPYPISLGSSGSGGGVLPGGAFYAAQAKQTTGNIMVTTGEFANQTTQNRYVLGTSPSVNPADGGYTTDVRQCNNGPNLIGLTVNQAPNMKCWHFIQNNLHPGFDYGGNSFSPFIPAFSVVQNIQADFNDHAAGLTFGLNHNIQKSGIGDVFGIDDSIFGYGGVHGAGDEGLKLSSINGGEANLTFEGQVTSTISNTKFVVATNATDAGNIGQGRYIWNKNNLFQTNNFTKSITSLGTGLPFSVQINTAIDPQYVSTYIGTLDASIATPVDTESPFTTAETFTVTDISGTPIVGGASYLCFSSSYHECALITAQTNLGGGKHSISANLRKPHSGGGYVMQGTPGALAVDWYANRVTHGANQLRFPVECFGFLDTTHLACQDFDAAASNITLGNVTYRSLGGLAATNTGGTVSITGPIDSLLPYANQPKVTFTGATPSAFNGLCTGTHYDNGVFTCSQAASTGLSTSVSPTMTIGDTGIGNTNFDLYSISEVIDVRNDAGNYDGTITAEPGAVIPFSPVTAVIQELHGVVGVFTADYKVLNIENPRGQNNNGLSYTFTGMSHYTNESAAFINNQAPLTNYANLGGTQQPPNGYILHGYFTNLAGMQYTPPVGGIAIPFGCPPTPQGCEDKNYHYALLGAPAGSGTIGPQGTMLIDYKPFTSTLDFQNVRVNFQDIKANGIYLCQQDGTHCPGGGGIPGGTTGQMQYNCAGSFCGDTSTTDGAGNFQATTMSSNGTIVGSRTSSVVFDVFSGMSRMLAFGPNSTTANDFGVIGLSSTGAGAFYYLNCAHGTGSCTFPAPVIGSLTGSASAVGGITVTGTPATGNVLTATSPSAANWQAPTGGGISALTGDVTASGSGSVAATIANNAVTTAKILNANVTLAKIANAAANSKLVGSGASGSGAAYSEITLGTNLSMSGTTLNATAGGGGNTTSTTLTTNTLPKANGANSIIDSALSDDGTTLSYAGSGSAGGFSIVEGTAISGVASSDVLYADSTAHRWKMNNNNGGAFNIPGVATAGTSAHLVTFAANGIDLIDGGAPPAGGGNVSNTGTPTSGQAAEWTSATVIQGVAVTGTGSYVKGTAPTITLANGTGLPISTGVSGLGTGVATFLATPSSANLAAAITDETGTGANVFANTPTLVTPVLGVATATSINGTTIPLSVTLTQTIASGTSALGTSAIASGACATVVTTTATNTASTDAISWNPNASIKAVTGYVPATTGGLSITTYPTANNVNFDVCNWSNASITPGAVTLNWRVTR